MANDKLVEWLQDSDPAVRWQVERDIVKAPEDVWQATRARVATEGFGARLLALQDEDGQWAGGAYFPANFDSENEEGQPWTATTWSLNSLREWGVDAAVLGDTADRLAANAKWEYDDLPYWEGEVDACINAWTIANGAWLGADVSKLVDWFPEHQLTDGGWNCEWVEGAEVSSLHSTLNSLKGLLAYETIAGASDAIRETRRGGEEYLLQRHLYKRLSTGEPIADWVSKYLSPPRWVYSVLNAAEYFRDASLFDERPPDPRMAEAIEQIRAARQPDGWWLSDGTPPGRVWFDVDVEPGEPSKWLTLSATRVLDWWDAAA
jgi:hypothetical protein